ncbi:hypothetical protein Ctha_2674 [Chloroherpeton thalassium ATCC 35110]|uniref:DUF5017 domain-containing protein n=1 Tax=Chloroherpeton thalassium (strain ATCC 35110 / GB-78) TaxID=517418 RepID=B3QYQ0_CHLT3|nr:choice-of-anchor J domain-containing protein [Chloroherpeton thalassium]ACF15123.1 hypothetical protein Ctha_2674 [Chloroherpeton thalassium ATCC 35110]
MLGEEYTAYGIGSSALITFDYNGEVPDDLEEYTQAETITLSDEAYASVNYEVGTAGYFSPTYPAKVYLPDILSDEVESPEEGQLILVSYQESDVTPIIDTASIKDFYVETFDDDLGKFSSYSVSGAQVWGTTSYGEPAPCAKMSGYSGGALANEDWLISPKMNFSVKDELKFSFVEAINYGTDSLAYRHEAYLSTDYSGSGDPSSATWTKLTLTNRASGSDWTFVKVDTVDLSDYKDEKSVYIGLRYKSTTSSATTWEVDNISIPYPGTPVVGSDPVTTKTLYRYENGTWAIVDEAYYLNASDYDRMGTPGTYDNFSASALPNDYLPNFMEYKYPGSGEGVSKTIVYKFYDGESTSTLATQMTYESGAWTSSYNYIDQQTQQFLVSSSRGKWVFDPTVSFTMTSSDYQLIVDQRDDKYVDSYGTAEFYSGASAYYSNFDLRISKREQYDSENFSGLSETEANKLIIRRLVDAMKVLLANKYPNAVTQVNGVDVHYQVTFESYNNDFSSSTWVADMQCTKDGPSPEFELVDDTFVRDDESVVVE